MSDTLPSPAPALPADFVPGNHFDKYRTANPVYQALLRRFICSARDLLARAAPASILEVGCGPGDLAEQLLSGEGTAPTPATRYIGTDISPEQIALARQRYPQQTFQTADARALPFPDRSFDLVLACAILEHVPDPDRALAEIARVTRDYVLISVPREPLWRALNLLRGKYLLRGGNTPGHLQHFSTRGIRALVQTRLTVVAEQHPLPWTILLARRSEPLPDSRDRVPRRPNHA